MSKYAVYRNAAPYFDLVRGALGDLVDGKHFFDIITDDIIYEVLYDVAGWPRALCGDGGFNMLMCEFLTTVHHKLPVKVVVYNNSAFGLISFEAESVGLPAYKKGIEFPNPDFAALADVCGGYGFKATRPGELGTAISEAFKVDGPAIIDAVVPADEMPNLPHIDLETVGHFAIAKIKEAVLTVTRS